VATARLRQPVPDPRLVNRAIPDELAEIVRRAMAIAPSDRFRSAADLRRALEAWLTARQGTSVVAVPPGVADPAHPAETGVHEPRPAPLVDRPPRRRRSVPPWLAMAAVVLLAVGGFVGMRLMDGDGAATVDLPDFGGIVAGTPGGAADPEPTEEPAPEPDPTERSTVEPTAEPTTPAPTPRPRETAAPSTPRAVAMAVTPDDAVVAFYRAVVRGDFDAAYALWSERMKAMYPRQANLDDRFAETAEITFSQLSVASQSATDATVQANFTERYDGGGSRAFIGYWRLIRVDGIWLLDEPHY
jgi:hypothetical protein